MLSMKNIKKKEFQLLGITSLFIASKYEDIYAPEVDELCYLCDNAYQKVELLKMESFILTSIGFEILFVSIQDIIEQFFITLNIKNENIKEMCIFLSKLFLF